MQQKIRDLGYPQQVAEVLTQTRVIQTEEDFQKFRKVPYGRAVAAGAYIYCLVGVTNAVQDLTPPWLGLIDEKGPTQKLGELKEAMEEVAIRLGGKTVGDTMRAIFLNALYGTEIDYQRDLLDIAILVMGVEGGKLAQKFTELMESKTAEELEAELSSAYDLYEPPEKTKDQCDMGFDI